MIHVNGKEQPSGDATTIRDVLLAMKIDPDAPGIAVAVDSEIAPRGTWPTRNLPDGARVEIVTATQGG